MPRAKDNRKPIGTELCSVCGGQAEFYQVQRGKRVGELYRKGCDCKAIQNAPPFQQLEWFNRMRKTPHEMIPFPHKEGGGLQPLGEPSSEPERGPAALGGIGVEAMEPEAEEPREPQAQQGGDRKNESKKTGLIGLVLLVGSVAVATMT